MTAQELITECGQHRVGPTDPSMLEPQILAYMLGICLETLLKDIDYDGDPRSGSAIAARMLAAAISGAEALASGRDVRLAS